MLNEFVVRSCTRAEDTERLNCTIISRNWQQHIGNNMSDTRIDQLIFRSKCLKMILQYTLAINTKL